MKIENKIGKRVNKKIDDLKEFQGELKELSEESYERLKTSLIKHGNIAPIYIWKDNILDGHQRLKTFLKLREEGIHIPDTLPCVEIEAKNKKEAKTFLLQYVSQHGKVTEEGLYEYLHDAELHEEIKELQLELELPGIDLEEFEEGYFTDTPEEDEDDEDDEVPDVPEKARSKLGDLYELGDHRVLCGDATSKVDIDTLLEGRKIEFVFTDPPYGMDAVKNSGVLKSKYRDIQNDDSNSVAIRSFNLIDDDIPSVWWGANYYSSALPDKPFWIVWDKNNGQSDQMDCELAWTNLKGVTRKFTQASEKVNRVHPTQKPIELIEWVFEKVKTGSVVDLFLGSGSTLITCEKTKRKCFGLENDPLYVDVIVQRYVDYTGNNEIKLNGKNIEW